jgi:hypothetical protein
MNRRFDAIIIGAAATLLGELEPQVDSASRLRALRYI